MLNFNASTSFIFILEKAEDLSAEELESQALGAVDMLCVEVLPLL